jgi:hypothetical protein
MESRTILSYMTVHKNLPLIFMTLAFFFVDLDAYPSTSDSTKVYTTSLYLLDLPFNSSHGFTWPSMEESRSITQTIYNLTETFFCKATDPITNPILHTSAYLGLEGISFLLSCYVPLGKTWMHEEYHRAVLSNRNIGSYDDIYNFQIGSSISVSHVTDESLELFKSQHPDEFVRLHEAGYEGQTILADGLLRDAFFHHVRGVNAPAAWNILNNSLYLYFSTTGEADLMTRQFNADEKQISQRDAIGWDYTAWAYDLDHPNEQYSARGIHPSGIGINRYIQFSNLSSNEQSYLRKQLVFSLCNFVRPAMYCVKPLQLTYKGATADVTCGLEHYLTPFGYSIGGYALARYQEIGASATVRIYRNQTLTMPGLDLMLNDIPFSIQTLHCFWSPRLALWLQPDNLQFYSNHMLPGLLINQKVSVATGKYLGIFGEMEGKTGGWVPGTVQMTDAINFRLGCILRFK